MNPRPVVCNYSGGACSFLAARRAIERFGVDAVTLLFADTGEEDPDTYRFMREGAALLGARLVVVSHKGGMDALIDSQGAIPSPRMAFCSRELKRIPCDTWTKVNAPNALRVFGMDWTENREAALVARLGRENVWCPMLEPPFLAKPEMLDLVRSLGIEPPSEYAKGRAHANCGGCCVKAGQAAWANALRTNPEGFAKWEAREAKISKLRGYACTILKDRRGGVTKPLPLSEFRIRVESQLGFDENDWGGCGCFLEAP